MSRQCSSFKFSLNEISLWKPLHVSAKPRSSFLTQVPIILLCAISKPLKELFIKQLRTHQVLKFERSAAFFYWWLVNFIRKPCPMPNAEGLASVLGEAKRLHMKPIVHICRKVSERMCWRGGSSRCSLQHISPWRENSFQEALVLFFLVPLLK